jgi:hypothetical protein
MTSQTSLEAFDGAFSKKMHWKDWLKTAWHHHLCIVNWPDGVPPPGPDFVLKDISAHGLRALVCNYMEKVRNPSSNLEYPTIIRWSDGERYRIFPGVIY